MDNLGDESLLPLLDIANIDRKKALFMGHQDTVAHDAIYYADPEVLIIKNREGLLLFNGLVQYFDYREKGIKPLEEPAHYPVYVLTVDAFAAGMRFGDWSVHSSLESLDQLIELDSLQDDFSGLRELVISILGDDVSEGG